jgi:hypothetical protein
MGVELGHSTLPLELLYQPTSQFCRSEDYIGLTRLSQGTKIAFLTEEDAGRKSDLGLLHLLAELSSNAL